MSDISLIDGIAEGRGLASVSFNHKQFTHNLHLHPHGELFLLRAGVLKSLASEVQWLIPAGHLCWIPPYSVHGAEMHFTQGSRLYLHPELCDAFPKNQSVFSCNPLIVAIFDRLCSNYLANTIFSEQNELLLKLLINEINRLSTSKILLPFPQNERLKQLTEFLLNHPDERESLDELAQRVGLTRRTLTRDFKRETGLSVGRWRQIGKLIKGIDMLIAGRSVTETAFDLGYESTASFVLLCQRHTGLSPSSLGETYRKSPK